MNKTLGEYINDLRKIRYNKNIVFIYHKDEEISKSRIEKTCSCIKEAHKKGLSMGLEQIDNYIKTDKAKAILDAVMNDIKTLFINEEIEEVDYNEFMEE